jgi:hypothetical protein
VQRQPLRGLRCSDTRYFGLPRRYFSTGLAAKWNPLQSSFCETNHLSMVGIIALAVAGSDMAQVSIALQMAPVLENVECAAARH